MSALVAIGAPRTRARVRDQLQDRGVQVTVAATVEEAKRAAATESFLVAIVDLTLPDGSGLEVLDELRESGSAAHVIVLSESPAERDQVHALLRGADEFVVKPFSLQELTASAVAMRRRADPRRAASTVQVGHCEIDMRARQVRCGGRLVDLTSKEFDLFAYLAVRPGHAFTREDLLKAVWRSASEWQQPATVTEHIRRLRNKVEPDPRRPVILVTVRGTGYRLDLPSTSDVEQAGTGPSVQVGVLIHIHGRIVFADEVAGDVAGVDADGLVGMQILDLVAPISLAAATERLADGEAGRQRRSEVMRFVRFDGDEVTVEVRSTAADWHGQPARRVQLTLVSDAPTRLRRLVTGVLSEVADAVIITDAHRHIRSWNAAAERVYGWAEAAVLGRHVLDILQWDGDNGQLVEAWDQLDRSGRWSGTFTQVTRDGSTVDILGSKSVLRDDTGETIGTVSVNRLAEVAGRAPTPELDAELAARVEQGIADDEFVVFYQPVADLVDGHLLALEALVRWEHPDRGCLAPSEFLDAAERSGLIVDLGELVLTKACVQAAEWRADGADIVLSVNVSTRQLASSGLAERFIDILQASGFNPAHLWLEVTETAVVEEFDKAAQTLRTLVGLGAGVSIDDFGTGWASLTYLQTFPVHALKIDGSFVAGAGINSNDTAIVRAVLSLGAELGLYVIAEGIETAEQRAFLATMGTTLGQGYFFGRPTSAAEVPIERARRIPTEVALERVVPSGRSDAHSEDDGPTPPVDPQGRQVATIVRDRRRPRTSSPAPAPQGALTSAVAADRIESDAVANLLRGLLRVNAAPAAAALLQKTVRQMGGTIVAAADAGDDALPVDVSLGEGPSMVVEVERFTVARMQLERLLPRLVEDARQAVDLLRRTERLKDDTTRDPLTGLRNRRALDLVLPARRSGSVVMVDLDQFKGVTTATATAPATRSWVPSDGCWTPRFEPTTRCSASGATSSSSCSPTWTPRPRGPGRAPAHLVVDHRTAARHLLGRGRPHHAGRRHRGAARRRSCVVPGQGPRPGPHRRGTTGRRPCGVLVIGPDRAATGAPASSPGAFVAHSEIRVTPQGTAALTAAFEDRLGEVEGWPGFHRLEVWADERDEGRFVMVSWWDDAAAFSAYLHSPSHQRSHDRIARGPDAPRPVSFARFRVVAR